MLELLELSFVLQNLLLVGEVFGYLLCFPVKDGRDAGSFFLELGRELYLSSVAVDITPDTLGPAVALVEPDSKVLP